ncbi:unnamed protein product [Blepharisma stoltei]|uniref:Uncharacterized protein n=1 Tax=Blepharisma stoltei TaxID=1481888 RepID=A0AAU9IP95_9CILI|nr:unnamed protein product [Blepharisma stoltei]
MAELKKPGSKSSLSRAIESVYSHKGLTNVNSAFIESKINEMHKIKKFIRKEFFSDALQVGSYFSKPEKSKKPKKKDHFIPITSFASTGVGAYHLYSARALPSQFLKTPVRVINKLTKKIYEEPKIVPFPLNLPIKGKQKHHANPFSLTKNQDACPILTVENYNAGRVCTTEPSPRPKISFGETMSSENNNFAATFHSSIKPQTSSGIRSPESICMEISESCNDLLQLNKQSKKMIARKTRMLKRGMNRCKSYTKMITQSNKRASYYLLHQQYTSSERPN